MVFLDTCIWVELTGVRLPQKEQEVFQAREASNLLKSVLASGEGIVTFREQLIEVMHAVVKARFAQYNREAKLNKTLGCGTLKEFRSKHQREYNEGLEICKFALHDICKKAKVLPVGDYVYDLDLIVQQAHIADFNDCIYYSVCKAKKCALYTFDNDYLNFNDDSGIVHFIHKAEDCS